MIASIKFEEDPDIENLSESILARSNDINDLSSKCFRRRDFPFDERHHNHASSFCGSSLDSSSTLSVLPDLTVAKRKSHGTESGSVRSSIDRDCVTIRDDISTVSSEDLTQLASAFTHTDLDLSLNVPGPGSSVNDADFERKSKLHRGHNVASRESIRPPQIIVDWSSEEDPDNPKNWDARYRWYLTSLAAILVLNSVFSTSSPSGILVGMQETLNFGPEVASLVIAIFLAGYCAGPLLWGPMSERIGRRPVFLLGLLGYSCFTLGCAVSAKRELTLACRFLSGLFASSPLTNSGGIMADIWDSKRRGIAVAIFSIAPLAGPAIGPIISGALTVQDIDWRWLYWLSTILSVVCMILTALTLRETFAPVILVKKAKRLRAETKDKHYVAPLELTPLDGRSLLRTTVAKPVLMLVREPILALLTVYISFVYGVLYLLFQAYPAVFISGHGFNELQNGLAFIPFFVGSCAVAAGLTYMLVVNPLYIRKVESSTSGHVQPEERLHIVMVAAPSLVISLFWFAWTSSANISHWAPMVAGALLGYGVFLCFLGIINYIIDVYVASAASALAANTVCRSLAGTAFPLFTSQMYTKLGPQWASSLLALVALLLAPIPFVFFRYGPQIRHLSRFAVA